MSKEEYAELHYLLAKLKYTYAEMALPKVSSAYDIIEKINDIQRIIIIDKKDGGLKYE